MQLLSAVFILVLLYCSAATTPRITRIIGIPSQTTISDNQVEDDIEYRIVNGVETRIEDHPYLLGLEASGRHVCGGSILSRDWALTAAHCVYESLRTLAFRAGSSTREAGGTVHLVKYYVYHESYNRDTLDYDVAVVRVMEPFVYTNKSYPVRLPLQLPKGGDSVHVAGWGYLQPQLWQKPRKLMKADLVLLDWEDCRNVYPRQISERMMCAEDEDPKKKEDICNGDSGGPLITQFRIQVGIVSWVYKCADSLPSVFTNVSSVVSWIRRKVGFDDTIVYSPTT